MMNQTVLIITHSILLILVPFILILFYRKYPLHLILKSKGDLQDMIDGIGDPLVVISNDFKVKRANKAYITLIDKNFADTIGQSCFSLLRNQSKPCDDCLLQSALTSKNNTKIEHTAHPSGKGSLSISFSPFDLRLEDNAHCVVEHIRDISLLENLKLDLEKKNHSLANAMKNLKAAQQNIHDELRLARLIQQGILPKEAPSIPGFKIAVTYHPITDVGGDIYDFIQFSPTRLGVFVGDASGHGLAAAFIGTISKMSLYNHSKQEMPVSELVTKINQDLLNNIHTGHYLTCFWGILDLENHEFTFCRAGHPAPLLIKSNGTIIQLKTRGTFLGLIHDTTFDQESITFENGDRFFMFTDGIYEVLESSNKKGDMLGYDRFAKLLAGCNNQPFNKIISEIQHQLRSYTYEDDYTLMVIEITAPKKVKETGLIV
jgi:serine phosphatase RsbU (regulator of sigma subunit)